MLLYISRRFFKSFLAFFLSLLFSIILIFLCNELVEYFYIEYYRISRGEDLSNDYGLGMLLIFFDIPIFIVSFFCFLFFLLKRLK